MAQLKMYWLKGTPIADYELPEGYSIVNYKECLEDKAAWVDCCKNGLVGDDTKPEFTVDGESDEGAIPTYCGSATVTGVEAGAVLATMN